MTEHSTFQGRDKLKRKKKPDWQNPRIDADGFDKRWEGVAIPRMQWHVRSNLHGRYGIELEFGEFHQIKNRVMDGESHLLKDGRKGAVLHGLLVQDKWVFLIVRKTVLVTALPPLRKYYDQIPDARQKAA